MAGYGRRGTGRLKSLDAKRRRRREAVNTALDGEESPSRRVGLAAGYVMGAVSRLAMEPASEASEVVVRWLLAYGDKLLSNSSGEGK